MIDGPQPKQCRNCGQVLEKRQHHTPPKEKQGRVNPYYFLYWYFCPRCKSIFHVEEAKRYFHPEKLKLPDDIDQTLKDSLEKEDVEYTPSLARAVHQQVHDLLANPTRGINNWEKTFLENLLNFCSFTQKQLNCLGGILGPLYSNKREIRNATRVERPKELPLRLEANKQ